MPRKVQAQRKFAQGAYIPHHTNNNTIERRGEGHEKPTAPPTIVHNMTAMSLLDQISFQSIHIHEKKLQPVVRLERLASPQKMSMALRATTPQRPPAPQRAAPLAFRSVIRARPKNGVSESSALARKARFKNRTRDRPVGLRQQPAARPMSPYTTASTSSSMSFSWLASLGCKRRTLTPLVRQLKRMEGAVLPQPPATPLSFLARNRAKERVLTNGIIKSKVAAKKKLKKLSKKLRTSRRLRTQRKAARCAKDDTDTEDDKPLTLLAKSKTRTENVQPESPPAAAVHQKSSEIKSDKKEGYYCADNIVRWLSDVVDNDNVCPSPAPISPSPMRPISPSNRLFKVPLPPKDRRSKRNDPPTPTPAENDGKTHAPPANNNLDSVSINSFNDCDTVKLYEDEQSVGEIERAPSTCPSERYVTVRDVVSAPSKDRKMRCKNCEYCSRADKVDKLSKVVETSANTEDVYEFDAEKDCKDDSSMLLREFRSRHARPEQSTSDSVYLDIGPINNMHIVGITRGNPKNNNIIKAYIIEKKNAKHLSEYNIIENETLFDQLIKAMDGLLPSLQTKELNKPPSPPQSEITQVNYQTAVADIASSDKEKRSKEKSLAGPSNTKSKRNPPEQSKSLSSPKASSNTAQASTSKRASGVTKTPTRSAKTLKKTRLRHTPYPKIPATRSTRNTTKSGSGCQPLAASTPMAGPSLARDAPVSAEPGPKENRHKPNPEQPSAVIRDAPVYYPTEAEFNDPIAYFENIMPTASKFGICKVVAPASFKPKFSINEKIRFNVANQYIARLYIRWGQASKEMCAIKAHLASQRVAFTRAPVMDNLEVDLPRLYRTVQRLGGLKKVIEKKRWGRVAEEMRFLKGSKMAKKLDEVYVKYLLPYDTLSSQERESIKVAVNKAWHKKNEKIVERAADPLHRQKQLLGECQSSSDTDEEPEEIACALTEAEDCIVPGRRMTLNNYARVAKAVQDTYFPNSLQPKPKEVEDEYWRIVLLAAEHICVNTASIDTGDDGFGFSKNPSDPFGRHPWNLKMISQNPGNVLHMLGRVLGVTVPTLHLGMVFSTSCWHRDPHGLPWIEYMHSGPAKIWYGIADEQSSAFRKAVATLCPTACQNKSIWLPSDITMIPPNFLLSSDVSLTRVEQKPNEYIIVFPKAYSSSISTGHTTSESVYFATESWLKTVDQVFQELRDSCEPTMFALEQLLIAVASDPRAPPSLLQTVYTTLASIVADEKQYRLDLTRLGVTATTAARPPHKKKPNGAWNVREQDECEVCRSTLYLSKMTGLPEKDSAVCLNHALLLLRSKKEPQRDLTQLSLVVYLTEAQLDEVMSNLQSGFVPTH